MDTELLAITCLLIGFFGGIALSFAAINKGKELAQTSAKQKKR